MPRMREPRDVDFWELTLKREIIERVDEIVRRIRDEQTWLAGIEEAELAKLKPVDRARYLEGRDAWPRLALRALGVEPVGSSVVGLICKTCGELWLASVVPNSGGMPYAGFWICPKGCNQKELVKRELELRMKRR